MKTSSDSHPDAVWNLANAREIRRTLIAANFAAVEGDDERLIYHVRTACRLASEFFREEALGADEKTHLAAVRQMNTTNMSPGQLGWLLSHLWSFATNLVAKGTEGASPVEGSEPLPGNMA